MRQDDSTVRKAEMAAIERVRRYVEMRDAKPLKGHGDEIHAIHKGTEWEALVTLADLRAILATLESSPADGDGGAIPAPTYRVQRAYIDGLWAGWNSGRAGETMTNIYARKSLEASDYAALTPTDTGEQG